MRIDELKLHMNVVASSLPDAAVFTIREIDGSMAHVYYEQNNERLDGGWVDACYLELPSQQQLEGHFANQFTYTPQLKSILRDQFAGQALTGIYASGPTINHTNEMIAQEAYDLADAMLAVRNKEPTT